MTEFFDRNGHLTELSLERLVQGEINSPEIEAHLESCEICRARLAAIRADNRSLQLTQPRTPKSQLTGWPIPLVAAAATLLFAVGVANYQSATQEEPTPVSFGKEDTFRIKGGFQLDFFRQRDRQVSALRHGDTVQVADKVGFRVSAPNAGYLLIAGIDGQKSPYLCFPQNKTNHSQRIDSTSGPVTLDEAVAFDETGQHEDLVALLCEKNIGYTEVAGLLKRASRRADGRLMIDRPGCQVKTIHLKKKGSDQP